MFRTLAKAGFVAATAVALLAGAGGTAHANTALAVDPEVVVHAPTLTTGSANCTVTGVFLNGRIYAQVVGEVTGVGAIAASNITCTVRQGTSTVLSSSTTLPGPASATATTGYIPVTTTRVCTSGYFVHVSGTIVRFGNAAC